MLPDLASVALRSVPVSRGAKTCPTAGAQEARPAVWALARSSSLPVQPFLTGHPLCSHGQALAATYTFLVTEAALFGDFFFFFLLFQFLVNVRQLPQLCFTYSWCR